MGQLASNKQKDVINTLKLLLTYWENTNDIKSPTLDGDMFEELIKLDLTQEELEDLEEYSQKLLNIIRRIK